MSKFKNVANECRQSWLNLPEEKRNDILRGLFVISQAVDLIKTSLGPELMQRLFTLGALVMKEEISPLGMGAEKAILFICADIPELAPLAQKILKEI